MSTNWVHLRKYELFEVIVIHTKTVQHSQFKIWFIRVLFALSCLLMFACFALMSSHVNSNSNGSLVCLRVQTICVHMSVKVTRCINYVTYWCVKFSTSRWTSITYVISVFAEIGSWKQKQSRYFDRMISVAFGLIINIKDIYVCAIRVITYRRRWSDIC